MTSVARRATNLTLDSKLVEQARTLKINLSSAAEAGIAEAIAAETSRQWRTDNAEAIQSSNEYVEKHGLPLQKYRMF